MGLFERTQHLERLAKEIAEENVRRLGSSEAIDEERTKEQVLDLEAALRECRLHLDEAEARRKLAQGRADTARAEVERWKQNAALATGKERPDLASAALARAHVYERERDAAAVDAAHHGAAAAHLAEDIARLEHRVEVLRAVRRGLRPEAGAATAVPRAPGPRRLTPPPRAVVDPLEAALEALRDEPPAEC